MASATPASRFERDKLNRAIEALGGTAAKRRGRPLGSKNKKTAEPGHPKMSTAEKKRQSERMKKIWAQRRKAAKG